MTTTIRNVCNLKYVKLSARFNSDDKLEWAWDGKLTATIHTDSGLRIMRGKIVYFTDTRKVKYTVKVGKFKTNWVFHINDLNDDSPHLFDLFPMTVRNKLYRKLMASCTVV